MIKDINKLLFLDIETVGITKDLNSLQSEFPQLCNIWEKTGYDYCKRRYPKDEELSMNEMFIKRSSFT